MLPYHRVDVLYVYMYLNWSGTEISCSLGLRGRSKSRGLWDRGEVNRVLLEEIEGWGWQSLEIIRLLMLLMFKILHELQRNATALVWCNMVYLPMGARFWPTVSDALFGVRKPSCWTCSCFRPPSNSQAKLEMSLGLQACRLKFESGNLDCKVSHASFAKAWRSVCLR